MDDERIARLEERVSNWMTSTDEYRRALCTKLDLIRQDLSRLPCDGRIKEAEAIRRDVGWLQKINTIFIPLAIGSIGGVYLILLPLQTTVDANSMKWATLEPEHKEIIRDVGVLKENSHRHRGEVETEGV